MHFFGPGHDTAVLGAWLQVELQKVSKASLDAELQTLAELMVYMNNASNEFFRTCYSHGLWLDAATTTRMVQAGWAMTELWPQT